MNKNNELTIDEDGIFIENCPSIRGCRNYGRILDEAIESCLEDIGTIFIKCIGIMEISITKKIQLYA